MLGIDDLFYLFGHEFGLQAVYLLFLESFPHLGEDRAVIGVFQRLLRVGAHGSEPGGKVARLDYGDGDAETFYLGAESLGKAFYGKLGAAVEPLVRDALNASYRAEIDNLAVVLPAHVWEDFLADVDTAVEVGFHLQFYLVPGGELEGSAQAHAGIVYQDINALLFVIYIFDYLRDAVGVANVALHVFNGVVFHWSAADAIDCVPMLRKPFSNRFSKARGGSCDDDYFVHSSYFGRCTADITGAKVRNKIELAIIEVFFVFLQVISNREETGYNT